MEKPANGRLLLFWRWTRPGPSSPSPQAADVVSGLRGHKYRQFGAGESMPTASVYAPNSDGGHNRLIWRAVTAVTLVTQSWPPVQSGAQKGHRPRFRPRSTQSLESGSGFFAAAGGLRTRTASIRLSSIPSTLRVQPSTVTVSPPWGRWPISEKTRPPIDV